MPGLDFERLRSEIPMRDVLDLLHFVAVNGRGDQLYGPCPLHPPEQERSRCFSVNLNTARFHCHRCGQCGNQLEIWAAATKKPIYDAAIELCQRLSKEPPWIQRW
jgi:DNA primase